MKSEIQDSLSRQEILKTQIQLRELKVFWEESLKGFRGTCGHAVIWNVYSPHTRRIGGIHTHVSRAIEMRICMNCGLTEEKFVGEFFNALRADPEKEIFLPEYTHLKKMIIPILTPPPATQ